MRATGFGVANALNDRHLARIIELFERPHGRVKPQGVIDGEHLICRDADFRPVIKIQGIAVGNDRI